MIRYAMSILVTAFVALAFGCDSLGDYIEMNSSLSCAHQLKIAGIGDGTQGQWWDCNINGATLNPPVPNPAKEVGCGINFCELNETRAYAHAMASLGRCDPAVVCTGKGDNLLKFKQTAWGTCVEGDGPPHIVDAGADCIPVGDPCDLTSSVTEIVPCCAPALCGHIDEAAEVGVCCLGPGKSCAADTDCCLFGTTGCGSDGKCSCTPLGGECGGTEIDSTCCDDGDDLRCVSGRCCGAEYATCTTDLDCCSSTSEYPQGLLCSLNGCSPKPKPGSP